MSRRALWIVLAVCSLPAAPGVGYAQRGELSQETRSRSHRMLRAIRRELERHYYDTTFGGIDMDARFQRADSALKEAETFAQLMGVLADFVRELQDSHTWFQPPQLQVSVDYGMSWRMVGDDCYVTAVTAGSDADAQGVRPGDRLVAVNDQPVTRRTLPLMRYVYYELRPVRAMLLTLDRPDGSRASILVRSRVTRTAPVLDLTNLSVRLRLREQRLDSLPRHTLVSLRDSVLVWRLPEFRDNDNRNIDRIMRRARDHEALVLDLRQNPGGSVRTLQRLVGHFLGERTVVGTMHERDGDRPLEVRPRGGAPFGGRLLIVVDAGSASAAEIAAYTLQAAGRARIVGDRSAGVATVGRYRPLRVGAPTRYLAYGLLVTVADFTTADGTRLEGRGVLPDSLVLPTPRDIGAGADPALAAALALAGVDLSPVRAGALYEREAG